MTSRGYHILIVEDDPEIANLVADLLDRAGYGTDRARDRHEAMAALDNRLPDLVLLDIMLPGEDGLRLLTRIRARAEVPVIMLTALGEMEHRVRGLRAGADDYLPKPFGAAELLARIEAVLRRAAKPVKDAPRSWRFDGWHVDGRVRVLHAPDGTDTNLTSAEFDILAELCESAGVPMARDILVARVQGRAVEPYDRSIDTLVSRLRAKVEAAGGPRDIIRTVRGRGYVFTRVAEEVEP